MVTPPNFDPGAPKKPTNVSRIAEAVARYNDRVRTRGAFSDALRHF